MTENRKRAVPIMLLLGAMFVVPQQAVNQQSGATVPSDLEDAIRDGDASTVRQLLDADVDVSESFPLMLAILSGFPEIVRLLLNAGFDVNFEEPLDAELKEIYGSVFGADNIADLVAFTPLSLAALQGETEIAGILVEAGAHVDIKTVQGTPVALAAATGRTDIVRLLIDAGADVNLIPARTVNGRSFNPLTMAIVAGHTEIVRLLIDAGADVNLYTPLLAALNAEEANVDMVELLLNSGAYRCPDPGSFPMGEIVLAGALSAAEDEGKVELIQARIDKCGD